MPRGHPGLPTCPPRYLSKAELLVTLAYIDQDEQARARVLSLETAFREKIATHVQALPAKEARFAKFNTSPFVLLIHSFHQKYGLVSEIESDILPAKLFSSMETSAGRMVEAVVLPAYGWECVLSEMHSGNSALDGRRSEAGLVRLATLKSGPRCLNDEMSENFADAIIANAATWAAEAGVTRVEFTYGVLYGTQKLSNMKDWHILRNIEEKLPPDALTVKPSGQWRCEFVHSGITAEVSIRIGADWWAHLGGEACLVEVATAMVRACVTPGSQDPDDHTYLIRDLNEVVSTKSVPGNFNVSLLQLSQLPWLFLVARHYCDELKA